MRVYSFNGDVYCEACGAEIAARREKAGKANKGEAGAFYPDGVGEDDFPRHCKGGRLCRSAQMAANDLEVEMATFLANPLTPPGLQRLALAVAGPRPLPIDLFYAEAYGVGGNPSGQPQRSLAPLRDGGPKENTRSAQESGKNGSAVARSKRPRDIAGFAFSATKDGPPFVVVGEMIAQLLMMTADIGVAFFSGRMPKFVPISDVSDEHLAMAAFVSQARERLDASPEPLPLPHVAGAGGVTFIDILRTVEDLLAQITDNINPDDDEGGLWVSRVVSH